MSSSKRPPPPPDFDENPPWTLQDFARARRTTDGSPVEFDMVEALRAVVIEMLEAAERQDLGECRALAEYAVPDLMAARAKRESKSREVV